MAFLTQNKAKFGKKLIITLVLTKNANFFAENWETSQKIVFITSTSGHFNCTLFFSFTKIEYVFSAHNLKVCIKIERILAGRKFWRKMLTHLQQYNNFTITTIGYETKTQSWRRGLVVSSSPATEETEAVGREIESRQGIW
jgi:hypothetical protein